MFTIVLILVIGQKQKSIILFFKSKNRTDIQNGRVERHSELEISNTSPAHPGRKMASLGENSLQVLHMRYKTL